MPSTPVWSHVVPGAPETHFKGVRHFDALLPKIKEAQIVSHCEHHEGDGGGGTVSTFVVHPSDGGTIVLKGLMEVYDVTTHTYVINFQGDPRYSFLKFTVKFLPGPSANTSTLTFFSDYTPVSDDMPPPDNLMEVVRDLFEHFAGHAEEHFAEQAKSVTV